MEGLTGNVLINENPPTHPNKFLMCFYLAFHKIHYRVQKFRTQQLWLVYSLFIIGLLFVSQVNGQSVELTPLSKSIPVERKLNSTSETTSLLVDSQRHSNVQSLSSPQQNCDAAEEQNEWRKHGIIMYQNSCDRPNTCPDLGISFIHEGESKMYQIRPGKKPLSNVNVSVTYSDNLATSPITLTASPTSFSFTPTNWCTAQTVIVTAVDNNTQDVSPSGVRVDFKTTDYDVGYPSGVAYNKKGGVYYQYVYDNDSGQGLEFDPTSLNIEIPEGGSSRFTVKLTSPPIPTNQVVYVGVRFVGDREEVTLQSPPDVVLPAIAIGFNFLNDLTQTETLVIHAGQDDDATDDNVTIRVKSTGAGYSWLDPYIISVKVIDDDEAALIVEPTRLTVDEGSTKPYMVKLATEPTMPVTITVESDNNDVTVDTDLSTTGNQNTLQFTKANWNVFRSVTATALEDDDALEDIATLTNIASGGDYSSVSSVNVDVTVTEDDQVDLIVTPQELEIDEGSSSTYSVELASEPSATVTVVVTGATGEVTVDTDSGTSGDQNTLTFTTSTWSTSQTVTVSTGQDDDGLNDTATLINTASGGDYASQSKDVEVTVIDDDDVELILSTNTLTINEGGDGSYTVKLSTEPSNTVTVSISSNNTDITLDTDGTTIGNQNIMTFTPSTWDVAQTVIVTAAEDDDGVVDTAILINMATGAEEYQSLSEQVQVTVTDNDDQELIITPTDIGVDEGSNASYTVKLATAPIGTVTVSINRSPGEVTVSSSSLTFTNSNWNEPQTVTVTAGQDDDAVNDEVTLTHSGSGGDYDSVPDVVVTITVSDNDEAELVVNPTDLTIDEGGSQSYTVKLLTKPSADVTVQVDGESGEVTVNRNTLSFTPTNWQAPQPVIVSSGQDADVIDGTATLTNTASGAIEYASAPAVDVEVTVEDDDQIGLLVSPQIIDIVEGGNNSYNVKLASLPTATVTVTIESASSTVTVSPPSLTFTISNWASDQTVTVTAGEDDNGTDEGVTLTNRPSGGDYGSAAPVDVLVRISDNDEAELIVNLSSISVNEGASGTYTVELSTEPTNNVTVTVVSLSEKITVDTDMTTAGLQSTLLFTSLSWNSPKTVTVNALEDDDASDDIIRLTNTASGVEYASVPVEPVVVTVDDDDEASLIVTPTTLLIPEGESESYTVNLATEPSTNIRVAVTGESGEISVNRPLLLFNSSNWDDPQTVIVNTGEDDDIVNDSATLINTASGGEYASSEPVNVDVTVIDDGRSSAGLTVSSNSIEEGESVSVMIELTSILTSETVIPLEYIDHSTEPPDFEERPASVRIPSGQSRGSIMIVTKDDETDEPNEAFTVAIDRDQLPSDVKLGTSFSERITIIDNDLPPPTEVTFEVVPVSVVEGDLVQVTVKLQSAINEPVTIPFSYSSGTGTPADPTTDYIQLPSVTIVAGQTEVIDEIQTRIDDNVEGPETFSISFGTLPPQVDEGRPISINVTILDNLPTITLSATPETIDEGKETIVSVTLSRALEDNVTIPLILTPITASAVDYQLLSSAPQILVNGGSTRGEVAILAINDDLVENDEQFSVELGTLPPSMVRGSPASVDITIKSDDTAGINADSSIEILEGSQRTVPVSLTAEPEDNVSVTVDGFDGSDLQVVPTMLDFTPSNWNQPKSIKLKADDDDDLEDDRVRLTLEADGRGFDDIDHIIQVVIKDDDRPNLLVQPSLEINEGDMGILNLSLTQLPTDDVTVMLTGDQGTDLTLQSSRTLIFTTTNWNDLQSFTFMAQEDADAMDDQLRVTLKATGGGYDTVNEPVEIIILDNDNAELMVDPTSIEIPEGGTGGFTVSLTSEPTAPVSITITGHENTDLVPLNTRFTFSRSNWSTPLPVNLQSNPDSDSEDDVIILNVIASGGDYEGQQKEVNVTIDDPGSVTIDIFNAEAFENLELIQIPVELNRVSHETIIVQYMTSNETAEATLDYTSSQGIVIFEAGGKRGFIQIEIEDDDLIEEDERFIITLDKPENAVLGKSTATATIKDDDSIATIAIEDAIAHEDASVITFDVYLSHPSPGPVSVQYRTEDGTASSGEDYVKASGMLTFAPGTIHSKIDVHLLKEDIKWQEETFFVHLESSQQGRIEKSTAMATLSEETDETQNVMIAYTARFVRTMSVQIVEALQERFQLEDTYCSVAERADMVRFWQTPVAWTPSLGELLSGCRISKSTSTGGGRLGAWGRGSFRRFNGRGDDAFTLSADVTTAMFGADYRWNSGWLAGVMVAHSLGDGSYELSSNDAGEIESGLTGFYPYLSYQSSGWEIWLSGGYGFGNASLSELDGDLTSRFGAIGFQGDLASIQSTRVNYFGDVLLADGKMKDYKIHAEVIRIRLGMQSSFQITEGIRPYVEANVRQDGGDAETGIGIELGGGLRIAYPEWTIRGEIRSQGLVLHSADGFTEWGVSGSIQVGNPSRGLMMQIRPSWGANHGRSLYHQQTILDLGAPQIGMHRTELELGYGIPIQDGRVRSIVGVTQFSSGQLFRLGGEIRPKDWMTFSISALAHHRQSSIGDMSLNLQGTLHY